MDLPGLLRSCVTCTTNTRWACRLFSSFFFAVRPTVGDHTSLRQPLESGGEPTTHTDGKAAAPTDVYCLHPQVHQCLAGVLCRDCGVVVGSDSVTPPALVAMAAETGSRRLPVTDGVTLAVEAVPRTRRVVRALWTAPPDPCLQSGIPSAKKKGRRAWSGICTRSS